jgi:hypothetical protein
MEKMKKILVIALLLSGCGVKDQSFYDLKSPCVSINDGSMDPCVRTSPLLNDLVVNS